MDLDGALTVAGLIAELGIVEGRKRLQKLVHLLGAAGYRKDFKQRFILHYYGPFSRQVAAQMDFLSAAELVRETRSDAGGYSYSVPGDDAKAGIDSLRGGAPVPSPWAGLAKQLDEQDTDFLEAVSTVVFLHARGTRDQELEEEFAETKPQLKARFPEARQYAKDLSLIH